MPSTFTTVAGDVRIESEVARDDICALPTLRGYALSIEERAVRDGRTPGQARSDAHIFTIDLALPELEDLSVFIAQLTARAHRIQRRIDDENESIRSARDAS